jgi:hypothetical protein
MYFLPHVIENCAMNVTYKMHVIQKVLKSDSGKGSGRIIDRSKDFPLRYRAQSGSGDHMPYYLPDVYLSLTKIKAAVAFI